MASFKNIFIKSKMNKDLDDRLLPQGEYRNAINIQVSKSESEDVGALENVLGNEMVFDFQSITKSQEDDLICVGYLVSEVDSSVFLFLTDNTVVKNPTGAYEPYAQNYIVRLIISPSTSIQSTVLVQGAFLNFYEGNPIHGVNLLEDLLFWTDNRNQPRKIRVSAAADNGDYYNIEDTISVAKYMPYNAPVLWQESVSAPGEYETTMKDVVSEFLPNGTEDNPYYNEFYKGDPDFLEDKFIRFSYRFKFDDGEYSVFAPFTQECFIPKQDGYFLLNSGASTVDENDMSAAYRSTVVDFMENKVNQIDLLIDLPKVGDPNYSTTTLENVTSRFKIIEIDILYKESDGLAVSVVDTITHDQITAQFDAANPSNTYKYTYSGTKPFRTLPEDQLIRVYDKVPVKALGQEIISNRIVYSNFQTKHTPPPMEYNVGYNNKKTFDVSSTNPTKWNTSIIEYPNSTLKQNRNYQAGFVLSDRFSRTTSTILSNSTSSTSISAGQLSTVYSKYNDQSVDVGRWPGDSLLVDVVEKVLDVYPDRPLYPGVYNGDPSDTAYNPLGFYTWKVVVKQQEQDYYNVYLPGILAAYPEAPDKELGLTSHVVLLNDNINKVPRDLSEVGPDQKQFRSSVQLFGRVENADTGATPITTSNIGIVNEQYYPSRFSDTVSTIQDEFDMFNITDVLGPNAVYAEVFYEANSNPLIGRISTTNQIGQIIAQSSDIYSIKNLAVYETEPVESRLDIYWETSSSGVISELNEQIDEDANQTIFGINGLLWNVSEYYGVYSGDPLQPDVTTSATCAPLSGNGFCGKFRSVVTGQFQFVDLQQQPITNIINPSLSVVVNVNGSTVDVSNEFELIQIKGTSSTSPGLGYYIDYNGAQSSTPALADDSFIIVNKSHRAFETTTSNTGAYNYNVTITGTDGDTVGAVPYQETFTPPTTGLDNLNTIIVGGETFGVDATSWGQIIATNTTIETYGKQCPPALLVEGGLTNQLKLYGSTGANGLSTSPDNQSGLQWSIDSQTQNGSSVAVFQIDSNSGLISEAQNQTAYGLYEITVALAGPDASTDTCTFDLVVGEKPANGSFSIKNTLSLDVNYAYILSAHNTVANAFDDITSGTGNSFTEIYPTPQGSLTSSSPLVFAPAYIPPGTSTDPNPNVGTTTTGCNGNPGGQEYNYLERNQIPSGANSSLAGALTEGTAYISLQPEIYPFSNRGGVKNYNDLSWTIEYRETPSSDWKAAVDIENNILSFNDEVDNYSTDPTIISGGVKSGINFGTDAVEMTQPVSNPGGSPDPITHEQDINFGSYLGSGPGNSYQNWFRVGSENLGSFSVGIAARAKWAVVGKSPYGTSYDKFGEYRVVIQRIGGKQDNCQSCAAQIGTQNNSQLNFSSSGATLETGDFYYDLGPNMAFAYLINPTLEGTRADAEAKTTHDQVVYAREGIHRYVTTFYTDASLQTPYTGYIQQTSGNIWLSYTAATNDGDDGGPFTTPYNAGTSTTTNKELAQAAEGASRDNATKSTLQNKRVWTCHYDTLNNKKAIGSAQPRT